MIAISPQVSRNGLGLRALAAARGLGLVRDRASASAGSLGLVRPGVIFRFAKSPLTRGLRLFGLWACCACLPAWGQTPPAAANPYSAVVPVADQSAAARSKALRNALQIVLTQVSGGTPASRTQLGDAARLVRQYGYLPDPSGGGLLLQADFDPRAVDSALREHGLPIFGVAAGSVEDLVIEVSGILSARDYSRALGQLRGIPGVREAQIQEVSMGVARFLVSAEGGEGRIAGATSVGDVMVREDFARYRLVR